MNAVELSNTFVRIYMLRISQPSFADKNKLKNIHKEEI